MGLPTSKRLRTQTDFQEVRNGGQRSPCGPFILQWLIHAGKDCVGRRLGVIASRRVGNAVKRNRGKRLMREIFRRNEQSLPVGVDVVIILRSSYDRHDYNDLEARFLKACAKIRNRQL